MTLRARKIESDDDGLFRWDQVKNPDPRCVCKTCRFFEDQSKTGTGYCKNEEKQFFVHIDRRIFDPDNIRCVSHEFHPDVEVYLKSEFKDCSLEELDRKRLELQHELSRVENFEEIKKHYTIFLQDNPFPTIQGDISDEIDLDFDFKMRLKEHEHGLLLEIDNATLERATQGTIWIQGFKHPEEDHYPGYHHSLHHIAPERVIIKQHQILKVRIHKDGQELSTDVKDFITLMQQPGLIERAIAVDEENRKIANPIYEFLHSFTLSTHTPFLSWNKRWHDSFIFSKSTFADLATFRQVFHCLEPETSLAKLNFALTGEGDAKVVEILASPYSAGEFAKLTKEFEKYIDTRKIKCKLQLSENDQALVEEMNQIDNASVI